MASRRTFVQQLGVAMAATPLLNSSSVKAGITEQPDLLTVVDLACRAALTFKSLI